VTAGCLRILPFRRHPLRVRFLFPKVEFPEHFRLRFSEKVLLADILGQVVQCQARQFFGGFRRSASDHLSITSTPAFDSPLRRPAFRLGGFNPNDGVVGRLLSVQ